MTLLLIAPFSELNQITIVTFC